MIGNMRRFGLASLLDRPLTVSWSWPLDEGVSHFLPLSLCRVIKAERKFLIVWPVFARFVTANQMANLERVSPEAGSPVKSYLEQKSWYALN